MTLKGPAGNEQAYVDAFNEVFGALDAERRLELRLLRPTGGGGARWPPSADGCLGSAQYAGSCLRSSSSGCFFVVPLGLIVAYSFWQTVDYNVVHDWTLDNYRYFFSVPTYVRTFWATVWVSVRRDGDHDRDRVPVHLLARPLRAAEATSGCCSCSSSCRSGRATCCASTRG